MNTVASTKKSLLVLAVATFLSLVVQAPAVAAMISTPQLAAEAKTEMTRAEITILLEREDIAAKLQDLGVDQSEVQDRINGMTDTELTELQTGLDSLPAGGDALGIVLTLLLIFLILDIAGVTDIFPGV
ncbi:MAG: PA2779 family protein [Pseudomonadales bacterium]